MKARAKRKDNDELVKGDLIEIWTPEWETPFRMAIVTGHFESDGITPTEIIEVHSTTIEYEVNGEWLSEGEIEKRVQNHDLMSVAVTELTKTKDALRKENARLLRQQKVLKESVNQSIEMIVKRDGEVAQLKEEVERLKADLLQAEYERAKAKSDRHKEECRADRLREENTTLKRENLQLREAEDFTEEELKSIPTNELEAEVVLLKAEVERLKEVIRILDTAIEKAVDIKHDHKSAYDIMCEVYKYIESGRNQAIKIIENQ